MLLVMLHNNYLNPEGPFYQINAHLHLLGPSGGAETQAFRGLADVKA